ncbi:hypothetical protein D3C71_1783630 [compost metagenome]
MHIGDYRHAELFLDGLEDPHALFKPRAAVRVDGRAVGLVERRLEHVRNAQLAGHALVFLAGAQRQIQRFQHIDAAEQHKGAIVGARDRRGNNDFWGGHGEGIL